MERCHRTRQPTTPHCTPRVTLTEGHNLSFSLSRRIKTFVSSYRPNVACPTRMVAPSSAYIYNPFTLHVWAEMDAHIRHRLCVGICKCLCLGYSYFRPRYAQTFSYRQRCAGYGHDQGRAVFPREAPVGPKDPPHRGQHRSATAHRPERGRRLQSQGHGHLTAQ